MDIPGYGGNALRVNLTTGEIKKEPLDRELAENYIAGSGMAQKLAYDFMPAGVDPWAPEAPIIICPGLLNGTLAPSSPKVIMVTKDPASGAIVPWFGSLHFGPKLKWAGYDAVIITGKAPKPVYLRIKDDDVEICDAGDLWGKTDIHEATDAIRKKDGDGYSVAAIGAAGENMVRISMVFIDKAATWGRAAGSTFGSKNLKAIAVDGTRGIKVADTERFMTTIDSLITRAMKDPLRLGWKQNALYFIWALWETAGYLTTKNWTETAPKTLMLDDYGAETYRNHVMSVIGCPACLAPDKAVLEVKEGPFKGLIAPFSTSIDPALSFGSRVQPGDYSNIVKIWDVCDRHGIDGMTISAMIAWLIELYERGIITKEDTGGMELKQGFEVTYELIDQTVKKEGLGAIIAEGFKRAEKMIGRGSEEYAYEVKGTEPDFDARGSLGVETFTSQVNIRPARDLPVGGFQIAKGRKPDFFQKVVAGTGYVPEERFDQILTAEGMNLPRFTPYYENWAIILDTMGICFRMPSSSLWNVKTAAEVCSAATGIERTPGEMLKIAERVNNLGRFLNAREGFTRKDDRFPNHWFKPLKRPDRGTEQVMTDYFDNTKVITREDSEQLLSEYYDEHGWDVKTGNPTKEKLLELGLDKAAAELK